MCLFWTVLLFSQLTFALCKLPQVQKCSSSDTVCMKSSAQKIVPLLAAGIPDLNIPTLDVMHVDKIKVDLAGLKLHMRNTEIKGLKGSVIDKLSIDMPNKQINLLFHVDVSLKGKYKASGKLLILPISGDGNYTMKLKNLQIQVTYFFDIIKGDNGKDVIDLRTQKVSYDVKDNAHYYMSNLFNGNKELSDVMLKFMNQSWKLLTQEFGEPVLEQPMHNVFNSVKSFLRSQPLEDIINN